MYLLRLTSLIFALGLLVSKLFAVPVSAVHQTWEDNGTRTYKVQPFTKVYIEGAFKVILEQGSLPGLRIKADGDNFKYIDVQSDSESLTLKITEKHFSFDKLILYITFQNLEKLEIKGGVSLETIGYVELKDFYFHIEGGANIEMNLKANKLKVLGEGGVKIKFDGVADEMDVAISGAGYLDATNLKTRRTECKIEGACAASVYATEWLDAKISGVGKIKYKGDPKVFKNIEGIGLVSSD